MAKDGDVRKEVEVAKKSLLNGLYTWQKKKKFILKNFDPDVVFFFYLMAVKIRRCEKKNPFQAARINDQQVPRKIYG